MDLGADAAVVQVGDGREIGVAERGQPGRGRVLLGLLRVAGTGDDGRHARLLDDPGIIRSRAKIDATIAGARIFQEMKSEGEDFSGFVWKMVGGKPIQNKSGETPVKTPLSEEISAALKKRGFKFVGPVIVYAWMQACGMVNDHDPRCFRRKV